MVDTQTLDYEPERVRVSRPGGPPMEGEELWQGKLLLRDLPDGHLACGCPTPPRQLRILNPPRRLRVKHSRTMKQVRDNTAPRLAHMHGERLLIELGRVAILGFGLNVWQWLPEHVGTHSQNSYHARHYPDGIGKAFDAYGASMKAFAEYVNTYAPQVDELIFNCCVSRKNGRGVPWWFWGALVWGEHKNHAHCANDGPAITAAEHRQLRATLVLIGLAH